MGEGSWKGLRARLPKRVRAVSKAVSRGMSEGEEGQGQEETDFAEVMTNDCLVSAKQS